MQVFPDAVIINTSPSQREILRNPKYSKYAIGMTIPENSCRPHIPITEIAGVIKRLRDLQWVIANDPEYANRRPKEAIARIISKIEDAAARATSSRP